MVLTRRQKEDAFNYILDEVLEKGDASPLKQALKKAGYDDIEALMSEAKQGLIRGVTTTYPHSFP